MFEKISTLNIRFLGDLQQTQTRLQNAERTNTEQSEKIKKLERDLKVALGDPRKQTIVCQSFSDDNENVTVSNDKRSVKQNGSGNGYCFLNHPKLQKNQILKWSVRVPKHKYGWIGMVIMLDKIKFYLLMIAFKRYWYICQSTN